MLPELNEMSFGIESLQVAGGKGVGPAGFVAWIKPVCLEILHPDGHLDLMSGVRCERVVAHRCEPRGNLPHPRLARPMDPTGTREEATTRDQMHEAHELLQVEQERAGEG